MIYFGTAVFQATLFDYNGVLVDDEAVHLAAFRAVLAPLGVAFSDAAYWERYIGYDDVGAFRAILADSGRQPAAELVRELCEQKRPVYLARAEKELRTFAGAGALVRRRAASGPVGVVSGALRSEIELGIELLGVEREVSFIVSAEDTTRCKPDPEGYELGLARLGVGRADRSRVLVIEDSVAGVQAAKSAGLTCVAVAHSHPRETLEAAGADWIAADVEAVRDEDLMTLFGKLHG